MLSFETPALEIEGLTVFRDHARPESFYYLAPPPKVARTDGRLMFDLFAYTVELAHSPLSGTSIPAELGAGFLTMGVSCDLPAGRRQRLREQVATQTGLPEEKVALAPVPYHKGSIRVIALDKFSAPAEPPGDVASEDRLKGRPTFVEQIVGTGTPSLFDDLRAIFSLSLSQEGVVFLQGLYADRAAPVGVVYELSFYGLRPSVEAIVDADLSRIYNHFGGGLAVQYEWFKADISAGLDYLKEQGAIRIQLTSQATGEAAEKSKELALSLFRDRIVQEMFRPLAPQMMNTGSVGPAGPGGSSAIVGLSLRYQRSEELKTVHYEFSERAPQERTHSPQAFLPVLLGRTELDKHVHLVDLGHDFFETLEVLVTGPTREEFESLKIRQVEATLTYGQPDDAVPPEALSLLFRADSTGDKTFAVKRRGRRSLAYRYSLRYEFTSDPAIDADATQLLFEGSSTRRTLLVNPTADFGLLKVEVEPGRIDKSIKQVEAALAYRSRDGRFTASQNFRLDLLAPANPRPPLRWQVRTRDRDLAPYTATCTFVFEDDAVYQAPPLERVEPLLRVDSPFRHQRQLLVKPNVVSATITQVSVEVEYDDAPAAYHRRFLVDLAAPFATATLAWPILDPARQAFRYRVTTHEPGFISEGEWQEETDAPSIIVGAVGSRVAVLSVRLIGGSLAEAGLDALLVKLKLQGAQAEEDVVSLFFEPGGVTTQEARLTLPPGVGLKYLYQTTAFKTSGQSVESEWKEETNRLLVISTRTL